MRRVTSADGTPIAYEQTGAGPNLVLVHAMGTFRAPWAPIFAPHFTVTAMDRRGRGDSGDGPAYSIEREFEDVAAVVASLTPPVLLMGHSFGALCALGAALDHPPAGLVLYEPTIYEDDERGVSPAQIARLEALLAQGNYEGVVRMLYGEIAGMSAADVDALAAAPAWAGRVASAPTIPRELEAEDAYRLPRGAALAGTPVLVLVGGDSPPAHKRSAERLAHALPHARVETLPGQQHIAMYAAPDLLVDAVLRFWRSIA